MVAGKGSGLQSVLVLKPSKCQLNASSFPYVCSRVRLLFSLVVCKLMAACTLLRGVTGFKLVFQSKCLRMDVDACVVHVLIQFLVRKETAASWTKCFYGIFRFEKRLLQQPSQQKTSHPFCQINKFLQKALKQNQGKNARDYKPVIYHVSLFYTPTTVGVSRRVATVK